MANIYRKSQIPPNLLEFFEPAEIGLEPTPDQFIAKLVDVFREVKRVLKDDGTLWLNISDSYFHKNASRPQGKTGARQGRRFTAEGAGARRAVACDTSGKEPANSQDRDCLCGSLCDACRKAYQIGKSHNDGLRVPKQSPSPCATNHVHTELQFAHLPTLDSSHRVVRTSVATQGLTQTLASLASALPCVLESTNSEFSQTHNRSCSAEQSPVEGCQLCGCSLPDSALASFHKVGCSFCTDSHESEFDIVDTGVLDLAYPYFTTESLKSKDLIGIPWLLAFALRADGWYLRQEIIWHKPNPMPESVTDRCTKSHESIFLLAKSAKYYFDNGAIKEPAAPASIARWNQDIEQQVGSDRVPGKTNGNMKAVGGRSKRAEVIPVQSFGTHRADRDESEWDTETRNKRSVWTVATTPYKGAHFATFPPALIEPCILAGAPTGGIVLDPFGGSGTTAQVAQSLGRKWILCELNEAYKPLIEDRTMQPSFEFAEAA